MPDQVCEICHEALFIEVEPDSEVEDTKAPAQVERVPDDVELSCGCHYHWDCFLEAYSITQCPNCSADIATMGPNKHHQVLVTVKNEGGVQKDFDILPIGIEESYLRTYPEERKGYAFHEFCREGDIDAIINMVKDVDEEEDEEGRGEEEDEDPGHQKDILRYLKKGDDGSGLHVAIRYQKQDVAWLLLALGSQLAWEKFPANVLQAMTALGLQKTDRRGDPDIRTLKDGKGRTPAELAEEIGGPWVEWLREGRLNP
ncbi:hypothetical protein PV11_08292 [Exophiala sideris]|uniref:Uncharacterized protein n=1 Tax=Exophiala sideris TaxID=1016849 RepID=A0A0D1X028_9EURO|nr:hypothetical protein PV11_08292 [Exophiala sideris]